MYEQIPQYVHINPLINKQINKYMLCSILVLGSPPIGLNRVVIRLLVPRAPAASCRDVLARDVRGVQQTHQVGIIIITPPPHHHHRHHSSSSSLSSPLLLRCSASAHSSSSSSSSPPPSSLPPPHPPPPPTVFFCRVRWSLSFSAEPLSFFGRAQGAFSVSAGPLRCEPCHWGLRQSSLWGHEACEGCAEKGQGMRGLVARASCPQP